jgi:fermentation-respiration switch protein FrsA (DUF1100 family)
MRSTWKWKLASKLALVALALGFSASLGRAQSPAYEGKLTLLSGARWGREVLPAGDYTFTVESMGGRYVLHVRGQNKSAVINANTAGTKVITQGNQLTLVTSGGTDAVRALDVPALGLTLVFDEPKVDPRRDDDTNPWIEYGGGG